MTKLKYRLNAIIMAGLMSGISSQVMAQGVNVSGDASFGSITGNITESVGDVPGLISSVSYLIGVLLGVLGIMKIKDHVENPTQVPLKEGAIRLVAGGALFALPIIYDAMVNTVGSNGSGDVQAGLTAVGDGLK